MTASTTSDVSDGPVLNFINKRLRALRKKLNRISQMEEGIAQGKPINKEQEETLRSKPSIAAAIDELEKLKQPLSVAVNEEIALAIERREAESKVNQTLDRDEEEKKSEQQQEASQFEEDEKTLFVQDLLNLIYFGSMFDVKSQNDFNSIMLTRAHERECCLAYDYVTEDDSTDMLGATDLDLISTMGSLLISRPGASSLSHQNALQRCIEHAKLWLEKSDQPIDVNSTVTYAGLREKLTKIMGSNYFTITPEMKTPVDVAAAAAGNYASFQVPSQVDGSVAQYEQKEDEVVDYQGSETYDEQSGPAGEMHKEEYDGENYVETSAQAAGSEKSHSEGGVEYRDQQQQAPRRPYQNQRSGGGRSGGGGGRRPYSNGGGGGGRSGGRRGGGGPHQNGRNQYYDQQGGGYYQKNYYNNRGRGGGRGNSYNPNTGATGGVNVGES